MRNKILVLAVFFLSSQVFAEQSNFNRSRVSHSWSSTQLSSGFEPRSGVGTEYRGLMSLQYDYVKNPYKLIDQNGDLLTEVVGGFSRVRLGYGAHINRNWFVGISLPFDNVKSKPFKAGEQHPDILADPLSQSYSGLGDVELSVKRRLESLSLRWNWVLESLITIPTSDEDSFNRDGDYSLSLRMAFNKYMGRENQSVFYGYLGARYAPNSRLEVDPLYFPFEAEKRLEFGIGINNKATDSFAWFVDLGGFLAFPFEDGQNPIEASVGVDYEFGARNDWKAYLGVGLEGFAGDEFSNDERYFLGLKKKIMKLSDAQVKKFKKTDYPVYSSSYDILLDSLSSETSVVKKIVGKAHSVYFASGGNRLNSESKLEIINVVSHLIKHQDHIKTVVIEGYADSVGNKERNLRLALERARAVKNVLTGYGVPAHMLKVKSFGNFKSGKEADSFGRLNNRRAEILVRELLVDHIRFPKKANATQNIRVNKAGALEKAASSSVAKSELFPKPFYLNGHLVEGVTILTKDNMTWGEVSEKLYGVKNYKEVLRLINYNRNPSLGDVVYFPSLAKEKSKMERFYFSK